MTARAHDLHFHNSMTRTKERFVPVQEGHVGIYVCGPTVYGHSHLGHAKSYISFDVIVRYLRHLGLKVRYVQNITDVGHLTDDADEGEDKLGKQARLDKVHPMELAETYTRSYLEDMDALKVERADIYPRATQHIPEQLQIIEDLIANGHAYEVDGNVYFSVGSWSDYGKLSGRQSDEGESGHRVQTRSDKRDPRDFALWKKAEGGHILRWRSPFGDGYPGWHIECSAMAVKYLGETFDIHGGGLENKFPHHECEIAQSGAVGHDFAKVWLHNNMIEVDGQKMGKSLGNFRLVKDALRDHAPEAIRYFILTTHYRSPANYTEEGLAAAAGAIERLGNFRGALDKAIDRGEAGDDAGTAAWQEALATLDRDFHAAMDDDVQTPTAISALFEFVRRGNALIGAGTLPPVTGLEAARDALTELAEGVLGLLPPATGEGGRDLVPFIDLLVRTRTELKQQKSYEAADQLRERLESLGVVVRDTKDGAEWSFR